MSLELQQIVDNITKSIHSKNKQMLNVSVQDLKDIASQYDRLELECRYVALNGDRILVFGIIPCNPRVREVNGIINHVLLSKYQRLFESILSTTEFFKYYKHLNDMSPEEYIWCMGED